MVLNVTVKAVPKIYSIDNIGYCGEIVSIPVYITDNSGVMGLGIRIVYDDSAMTPVSVEQGVLFSGSINDSIETSTNNSFNIFWAGSDNVTGNGIICNVNFRLASNAYGKHIIEIEGISDDTFDSEWNSINLKCEDIEISISDRDGNVPKIISKNFTVKTGTVLDVPFRLIDNSNIKSAVVEIEYDTTAFTPISISGVNAKILSSNISSANGKLVISLGDIQSVKDVDLFVVQFEVAYCTLSDYILNISEQSGLKCADSTVKVIKGAATLRAKTARRDGKMISIPLEFLGNTGIMGFRINVEYNDSLFTPISAVTSGSFTTGATENNIINANPGSFYVIWIGNDNINKDGECLVLSFELKSELAVDAEILLSYSQADTFDSNWNDVELNCRNIVVYSNKTVTFNANGGSCDTASKTVSYGSTYGTMPSATKTGYSLLGWYTQNTGGTKITADTVVDIAENQILYAQWTANSYTIGFNGNGSTSGSMSNLAMTYDVAKTLTANVFARTGYTFNGWNTKSDGTGAAYANNLSVKNLTTTNGTTVTLYAQWMLNTYTIDYDLAGGSVATVNPTSYNVTTADFTLNNPAKTGYTFAGWTGTGLSTATKTVKVTKGSTGNRTYTATWTANTSTKYVVNHYQMNVSGSGYTLKETENKTGTTASSVTIADLKKTYTGFTFEGGKGATSATTTKPSTLDTSATVLADGTRVINLYYSRNKYALTLSKGTGISAVAGAGTYYYGQSVAIDATVSTGYTWSKWSDNNTTKNATITMPANALTLTANATLNAYTIGYDLAGGSVVATNPTSYNVTTADFTLNNPTKTGYTFAGWIGTGLGTATKTVTVAKGSTGNRTYTATWTAISYTIAFNGNGSTSGSISNMSMTYGVAKNLPANTFVKIGYTFTGWNTKADGSGTSYTDKVSVNNLTTSEETVILYAQWTANVLTVNYNVNGGSIDSDKYKLSSNTLYHLTENTIVNDEWIYGESHEYGLYDASTFGIYKTGFSFSGWGTEFSGGTVFDQFDATLKPDLINANINNQNCTITLYAQWTANSYLVKFNGNGSTSGSMSDQVFTYGVAQNLTANAFKREYAVTYNYNGATGGNSATTIKATATFNGWATSASGTKVYDNQASVNNFATSGTCNLYANWTLGTVTLPTPVKTGYTFGGWYTDSGLTASAGSANAKYTPNANITLYAKWTAISYTIAFNGNGSTSGSMSNMSMTYGVAKNLTANAFAKTGYTFKGWNTKADGSETAYADKVSVNNLTSTNGATVTLYAQWTTNGYTVTFDANGGNCDTVTKSVVYASEYGDLPVAIREKFIFKGWYTSLIDGIKINATDIYLLSDNQTLYAYWENADVTDISIKTLPNRMVYTVGEELDTTGLTLKVCYSDGTEEILDTGFECTPTKMTASGEQEITVTFADKDATFTVTVKDGTVDENAPQFVMSTATGRAGEQVEVTIEIKNNPGLIATSLNISYDKSKLTLIGVEDGGLLGTGTFVTGKDLTQVPYTVFWEDALASDNYSENGVMVTFTFEIAEDADPGTLPIMLNYVQSSTFDVDINEVEFAVISGGIEVTDRIAGDANEDGIIDLKDVVIIRRWLAGGWDVTVDASNSDVNGDKIVDLKDVVLIRRYLSGGWGVVLQ